MVETGDIKTVTVAVDAAAAGSCRKLESSPDLTRKPTGKRFGWEGFRREKFRKGACMCVTVPVAANLGDLVLTVLAFA
uniref:Uncharacterized protein n=1 Tax=Oryza brachyantha TaxID=4533 RepID=J3MFW3_ORYBR